MTKISNKVESGNILRINTMALSEMARNGIIKEAKTYGGSLWKPERIAEFVEYQGALDGNGRDIFAKVLLQTIGESNFWNLLEPLNGLNRVTAVSSVLTTYREFTGSDLQI